MYIYFFKRRQRAIFCVLYNVRQILNVNISGRDDNFLNYIPLCDFCARLQLSYSDILMYVNWLVRHDAMDYVRRDYMSSQMTQCHRCELYDILIVV
jgi:hypothetical protein